MTGGEPSDCAHLRLVRAAAVCDARRCDAPGALLLDRDRIIAAGPPASIGAVAGAVVEDRLDAVLLPALVNGHAHLDLTHLGPRRYDGDFTAWLDAVRRERATDAEAIADSVRQGVALARAGGTGLVGDIAGAASSVPLAVMRAEGLAGVSYLEHFGIGRSREAGLARLKAAAAAMPPWIGPERRLVARAGLEPHAPYSCDDALFRSALASGRPVATHLAESLDEAQFVRHGSGPQKAFLRSLELWEDSVPVRGTSPVAWLLGLLEAAGEVSGPIALAHVNYPEPGDLERLAAGDAMVVYCPRASAYFGHPHQGRPAHGYRAMLAAGVRVALGTDSILCAGPGLGSGAGSEAGRSREGHERCLSGPTEPEWEHEQCLSCDEVPGNASWKCLSILAEMRLLRERDGADPSDLLAMATTHGARALGFATSLVTLDPGPTAGILALPIHDGADPRAAILAGDAAPDWVLRPPLAEAAEP